MSPFLPFLLIFVYELYATIASNMTQGPSCNPGTSTILDTTSLTNWTKSGSGWIRTHNDANDCWSINPCILMTGTGQFGKKYIQQTLDSSTWSYINIRVEIKTDSFDEAKERAFIETVCDGVVEQDGLSRGNQYSTCIYRETPCSSLILRVGAQISGYEDYFYVTKIAYEGESRSPTEYPTLPPSNDPTLIPTADPTQAPTINPTFDPSIVPTQIPTNVPTYNPTKDPSLHPTLIPTEYPSLFPSKNPTSFPTQSTQNPTPSPIIGCVAAPYITLNTTSLADWEQKVVGQQSATSTTFRMINNPSNCYGINPCIRINGIEPNTGTNEDVYIERTLDSSLWSNVNFGTDFTTDRLDDVNEYAFFETECDGNIERDILFRGGQTQRKYLGCFYRSTPCNELIIRIGASLDGTQDYLWISQIVYKGSTDSPTLNPTLDPSFEPTVEPTNNPTLIPTIIPSMNPSKFPTILPSQQPSQNPTTSNPTTHFPTIFVVDGENTNDGAVDRGTTTFVTTSEGSGMEQDELTKILNTMDNGTTIIIVVLSILLFCAVINIMILIKRNKKKQKISTLAESNIQLQSNVEMMTDIEEESKEHQTGDTKTNEEPGMLRVSSSSVDQAPIKEQSEKKEVETTEFIMEGNEDDGSGSEESALYNPDGSVKTTQGAAYKETNGFGAADV